MRTGQSEQINLNYAAKIFEISDIKKHPNADSLQVVTVDFQKVITGPTAKAGDLYAYFPPESSIDLGFLSATNSFRDSTLNRDENEKGFFENKGRVRTVKLRGEYSVGYIVPLQHLFDYYGKFEYKKDELFDTIGDMLVVKKYIVPVKASKERNRNGAVEKRISRLVEGQVRLHVDTENLRRNAFMISPKDTVSITYKVHGTSGWVSNVLVKRKLSIIDRVARMFGANIQETEYDFVYGSRRVVKNEYETRDSNHFYDVDIWGVIKDEMRDYIPKGYTVYYEAVGYLPNGSAIQGKYDYGCEVGQHKIYVYRITFTNADGHVRNLTYNEMAEFVKSTPFDVVELFYYGEAGKMFKGKKSEHWHESMIEYLQKKYTEKDCHLCKNVVPEEGIVLRKESINGFEAYKLKSFKFLDYETQELDKGDVNIEDNQ